MTVEVGQRLKGLDDPAQGRRTIRRVGAAFGVSRNQVGRDITPRNVLHRDAELPFVEEPIVDLRQTGMVEAEQEPEFTEQRVLFNVGSGFALFNDNVLLTLHVAGKIGIAKPALGTNNAGNLVTIFDRLADR